MTRVMCVLCTVLFTVTSCSSETIKVENDSIQKKTTITMEMTHFSENKTGDNTVEAIYKRTYNQDGVLEPTVVHIKITTQDNPGKLGKNAFMKMGIIKKKVVLHDIQSEVVTVEDKAGSNGNGNDVKKKYRVYSAKMPFTIPIERHIVDAGEEVLYRFYIGNRGINFSVEGKQLEKLIQFMNHGFEEKSS
ncbi:MAG: hypothetical protein ACOCX9_00425 [Spirochaetota bacterium]